MNRAADSLINRIVFMKDCNKPAAATKALDRVLLWNHYVVP
jgi:microcin C transport system substrate-binding protein